MAALLFLLHILSCWFMTGLIWFVQVVHYRLFPLIDRNCVEYHETHQRLTGRVVALPMIVEGVSGVWLWATKHGESFLWTADLLLLATTWISTTFLQVPCHRNLVRGYLPEITIQLRRGNWIRTVCWTLRSLLLTSLIWQKLSFPG